eukprot:g3163.t1
MATKRKKEGDARGSERSKKMLLTAQHSLRSFNVEEETAEGMVPIIGRLYRRCNVVVTVFNTSLANLSPIQIINAHANARDGEGKGVHITDTALILEALDKLQIGFPMRADIGFLARAVQAMPERNALGVAGAVRELLQQTEEMRVLSGLSQTSSGTDVVLYGFGRIGRLVARLLIEKTGAGNKMLLRAIVVRKKKDDLRKRASLFMLDSVHGPFKGRVEILEEENILLINGNRVQVIYANSPDKIDYTQYGIKDAVIVDNTGVWRTEPELKKHLQANGVSKVLLTAPGKGNVPNIVYGVNHKEVFASSSSSSPILSAASCTTNAVVPVLFLMQNAYGVTSGHIESVHSFTNDQHLIDNLHKKSRRGRSAPLNLVLTETGAASATAKCLPSFKDKLTASAVRVPTPNVSLAILILQLEKETTKEEVNSLFRSASLQGELMHQIGYSDNPDVVSSDMVGSRNALVVDSCATTVAGKQVNLYCWYDNEFGYSCQVIRILQKMGGVQHVPFP